MYTHKLTEPRSEYIRYRGETSQIDIKDTIIAILSSNPGLNGAQIANLIYDPELNPNSIPNVYKALKALKEAGNVERSAEKFYYLIDDAIAHDMAKTAVIVDTLGKSGVGLDRARFLSSGIIMAGETAIAESNGENFDIDKTVAQSVAAEPIPEPTAEDISADVDEDLLPEDLEISDPFASMGDEDREALVAEADELIAQDIAREEAEQKEAEEKAQKLREASVLSNIKSAQDLLGLTVEINPGKFKGQVAGTILELRATGLTFLITFSSDDSVQTGSVLPLEYASGLTYKVLVDFDVD